jgi:hypothetical protein
LGPLGPERCVRAELGLLSVERGFLAGASTVALIAGDAPLSISDHRSKTP